MVFLPQKNLSQELLIVIWAAKRNDTRRPWEYKYYYVIHERDERTDSKGLPEEMKQLFKRDFYTERHTIVAETTKDELQTNKMWNSSALEMNYIYREEVRMMTTKPEWNG